MTTSGGDKFFQGIAKAAGETALIFAANHDVRRLARAKYWIADATFDTVPGLFRQLFTIHGSLDPEHTQTFPVVYVLMQSKKEDLYKDVLARIVEIAEELDEPLNPNLILTDFEKGMINAFETEFPDAEKKGCFFHLSQNMWKSMQANKLSASFGANINIFTAFKRLQALAFVPPAKIPAAFDLVSSGAPALLDPIVSYFAKTYVYGRNMRNKRSRPLYHPLFWSVYSNVLECLPRTTNKIEAWHSRWSSIIGARHVGVHRILEEIQLEQKYTEGRVLASHAGEKEAKKKKFEERNQRLFRIVSNFDTYQLDDYLTAIASNLA